MRDDFYKAFEDKYRGSRDIIKARLQVYLPFIEPLLNSLDPCKAVDLGCGRGEWIELLLEYGIDTRGVDLDERMLDSCKRRGLTAELGDVAEFITTLPGNSQSIISAFHVVEHISFEQLRTLVSEAFRVLKPGGLLIMETPNPENLIVASRDFYLDPTHQKPVHPELLKFLAEYYGYARSKIVRLQEAKGLYESNVTTLNDVLGGVSPDYAVIAQKTAPAEVLEIFNKPFSQDYGLLLNTLVEQFDKRFQQATEQAQQATEQAQQATEQAQQAIEQAQQTRIALQEVHSSHSWRMTKPLREVVIYLQWMMRSTLSWLTFTHWGCSRGILRKIIIRLKEVILRHPSLKRSARFMLQHSSPRMYTLLKMFGITTVPCNNGNLANIKCDQLSPRARQIYHKLKVAIDKNKGLY